MRQLNECRAAPETGTALAALRGQAFDTNCQKLNYCDGHRFGLPFGIVYKDKGVVASNRFSNATFQYGILRYDGTSEQPAILRPIDDDEYLKLANDPKAKHITISPDTG